MAPVVYSGRWVRQPGDRRDHLLCRAHPSPRDLPLELTALAVLLEDVFVDRGDDRSGRAPRKANSVRGELAGDRLPEQLERRLAGAVVAEAGPGHQLMHARDVDDHARCPASTSARAASRAEKGAGQDSPTEPGSTPRGASRAARREPGVVDEDVYRTAKLARRPGEHLGDLRLVRDVGLNRERSLPVAASSRASSSAGAGSPM